MGGATEVAASATLGGVFLLRVMLPDRPGSLGAVATALGHAQADIHAVEIVERGAGYAVDDFMLTLPTHGRPDALFSACAGVPGVEVMWVSSYPDNWSLMGDTDVLEEMTTDPERAEEILLRAAPAAFHSTWALVTDRAGIVQASTPLAPAGLVLREAVFGSLRTPHVAVLPAGWAEGWGEHAVAVAPFRGSLNAIVLGRPGPEFRRSELVRLRHLAMLSDLRLPTP